MTEEYRGHTIERRGPTDWRVTSPPEVGAGQIIHLTAARARKWIDRYLHTRATFQETPEGRRALERLTAAVFGREVPPPLRDEPAEPKP